MRLLRLVFFTYISEVINSAYGGEWVPDDNDPQGEINIAVKLKNGSVIFPVQRAMKRYMNGREDSIYDYGVVFVVMLVSSPVTQLL